MNICHIIQKFLCEVRKIKLDLGIVSLLGCWKISVSEYYLLITIAAIYLSLLLFWELWKPLYFSLPEVFKEASE